MEVSKEDRFQREKSSLFVEHEGCNVNDRHSLSSTSCSIRGECVFSHIWCAVTCCVFDVVFEGIVLKGAKEPSSFC